MLMRKFRILLTLLLCLTIPVAGWASVLGSFVQTHSHGNAEAAKHATHFEHADVASAHLEHHKHHTHCDALTSQGKPCKSCKCGCGVGVCTSSSLSLFYPVPATFKLSIGKQLFSRTASPARAIARGNSPLRPPIA